MDVVFLRVDIECLPLFLPLRDTSFCGLAIDINITTVRSIVGTVINDLTLRCLHRRCWVVDIKMFSVARTYPAGTRAWRVCNASPERVTGRLQELPSNLPPVSLLQVDVCHRGTAPDDYTGGPPTYVCALKWFTEMILREGRQDVITVIDYSAAFDTESQMFLDEALAEAGVGAKVGRTVQSIYAAATGVVRLRHPGGTMTLSEPFDIARGILHGDSFSPVAFIAGLERTFRMHDLQNPGVAIGVGESTTIMSKFEYADDAALVDADASTATARVTALVAGSITDAAMIISQAKSKVMHIHRKTHVS